MGRWQKPCIGDGCDHSLCGRREVSFDWRTNRSGGARLSGEAINHLPSQGDPLQWSRPFDPDNLTGMNKGNLILSALPDAHYFVPEHIIEEAEFLDDEKARRAIRGL
jgi:hypothetical protein